MSSVRALGQLGVETRDLAAWRRFGSTVLGLQESPAPAGELRLRMDAMTYRLAVAAGDREGLGYLAWEVADEQALSEIGQRLESAGYPVREASPQEAAARDVPAAAAHQRPVRLPGRSHLRRPRDHRAVRVAGRRHLFGGRPGGRPRGARRRRL